MRGGGAGWLNLPKKEANWLKFLKSFLLHRRRICNQKTRFKEALAVSLCSASYLFLKACWLFTPVFLLIDHKRQDDQIPSFPSVQDAKMFFVVFCFIELSTESYGIPFVDDIPSNQSWLLWLFVQENSCDTLKLKSTISRKKCLPPFLWGKTLKKRIKFIRPL